jgi:hypothetical protein
VTLYVSQNAFRYYPEAGGFWITNRAYISYPIPELNQGDTWKWQEAGGACSASWPVNWSISVASPKSVHNRSGNISLSFSDMYLQLFHCSCHECVNTEALLRKSQTLQRERKLFRFCVTAMSAAVDIELMWRANNPKECFIFTHKYLTQTENNF